MEYIQNEFVYHVVTNKKMQVGQKMVFGKTGNLLYDKVLNWEFFSDENKDSFEIVKKKLEDITQNDYKTIRRFIYENAMIMREYVLEQVRKDDFKDYPSRFTSLFCVRKQEDTQFWVNVFNRTKIQILQIVKMKVTGKIFDGNANYILRDAKNLSHKIDLAKNYWQGAKENSLPESVFEGEVEVVEILKEFV